jgi:hypothetical protein
MSPSPHVAAEKAQARRTRRLHRDRRQGFAGAEFETLMAELGAIFLGLADADGPESVARFADVIAAFRPAA